MTATRRRLAVDLELPQGQAYDELIERLLIPSSFKLVLPT